mgnify:CR=1 FL=1
MYKIAPTTQLVFQIVNDKLSKQQCEKLTLFLYQLLKQYSPKTPTIVINEFKTYFLISNEYKNARSFSKSLR